MMKAVRPRVFGAFSAPPSPKGDLPSKVRTPQDTFAPLPPAPAPHMPDHLRWVEAALKPNSLDDARGNHYEFFKSFGHGAFGRVYVAQVTRPTGEKKLVCLKRMEQDNAAVAEVEAMLACESHLGPYNVMMVEDDWVFLEELLCDGNLGWAADQFAERHPELLEAFVLSVLKQVGTELKLLHDRNMVHRDIKPANILYLAMFADVDGIERRGKIFTGDFGRGTKVNEQPHGPGLATPGFTSLQAATAPCTPPDDLWALGVTALALLMGETPFDPYTYLPPAARDDGKTSGIDVKKRRYRIEVGLLRCYTTWFQHNRPSERLDDFFRDVAASYPRVARVLFNSLLAPEAPGRGTCAELLQLLDTPGIAVTDAEAQALDEAWKDIPADPSVAVRKEVHGVERRPLHRSRTYDHGLSQLRTGYESLEERD